MGRTSQIDEKRLYGVIGQTMLEHGTVSMQNVVSKSGVSTGSLYHRFQSRETMLAHAWVDALTAFQEAFIEAMTLSVDDPGEQAALATPRFCRRHHDRAIILACCQQSQFVGNDIEEGLMEACDQRNLEMASLLKNYAKRKSVSRDACYLAVVHYPLAVVRSFLPKRKVPKSAEKHVIAAFNAAMTVAGEERRDRLQTNR